MSHHNCPLPDRALPTVHDGTVRFPHCVMARLPRVAVAIAIALAGVACWFALTRALEGSVDFQWSAAHDLLAGRDIYAHPEDVLLAQRPNYLHGLYFLLLPFGALPFPTARCLWAVTNLGLLVVSSVLIGRGSGWRGWKMTAFVATVLASNPSIAAISVGQQAPLILWAAVFSARARRAVPGGVWLAIVLTKYSFAPLGLPSVVDRRHLPRIAVAIAVSIAAWLAYCAVTGAPLLPTLVAPLRSGLQMVRGLGDVCTMTAVISKSRPLGVVVGCATACVLAVVYRRALRSGPPLSRLACAVLIAFLSFPHVLYDFVLLAPVLAVALGYSGWRRALPVATVAGIWGGWLVGGNPWQYQLGSIAVTCMALAATLAAIATEPRHAPPRRSAVPVAAAQATGGATDNVDQASALRLRSVYGHQPWGFRLVQQWWRPVAPVNANDP